MVDLRDVAKSFGCNVSMLANTMGYTRQGLYYAIRSGDVQRTRMHAALEHLKTISELQYQEDVTAAAERSKIRSQGIRDMEIIFNLSSDATIDQGCGKSDCCKDCIDREACVIYHVF